LWDDREDLSTTFLKHVKNALDGKEAVWILLLTDALEEDGQVMVVVELLNLNLPIDTVLGSVFNSNRKISTIVESAEFRCRNVSLIESTSSGLLGCRLLLGLEKTNSATTETLSFLEGCYINVIILI
jgi:hypothetical protein